MFNFNKLDAMLSPRGLGMVLIYLISFRLVSKQKLDLKAKSFEAKIPLSRLPHVERRILETQMNKPFELQNLLLTKIIMYFPFH